MGFALTLKTAMGPTRTVVLAVQAEAAEFRYGWLFDSHVLWQDPCLLLTLSAAATERLPLGTCVTNPACVT